MHRCKDAKKHRKVKSDDTCQSRLGLTTQQQKACTEILNNADCCETSNLSLQNDVKSDANRDEDYDQMLKKDASNASMPLGLFASSSHHSPFTTHCSLHPAMTLAEVLITLGIIGVVAAMTIPALIQNTRDQQTVVAVKKAYSVLSSAFTSAVQENGTADNWALGTQGSTDGAAEIMNNLSPYLATAKNCGTQNGCFGNVVYKTLNGHTSSINFYSNVAWAKAQLKDGSTFATWSYGASYDWSGFLVVDINGNKAPNQYGIDAFWFVLSPTKIVPYDYKNQSMANCNKYASTNDGNNGRYCTSWILFNNNMDYMHCELTNWATQHSCP